MAIRFSCPSCRQPIEVDDAWGGSSVACPYCRKVVVAPRENAWPTGDIPVASPVQPGFSPPPPPTGYRSTEQPTDMYATPTNVPARQNSANWGLMLTVAGAALASLGFLIWMATISSLVLKKTGDKPSEDQLRKALIEVMSSAPASPPAATVLFVGVFCAISGLALAIRSLARNEGNTGRAITACILGGICVFCQVGLMFAMAGGAVAPP